MRLLEIVVPADHAASLERTVHADDGIEPLGVWRQPLASGDALVRVLVKPEDTERLLDRLQLQFSGIEGFRVLLLQVEATIPRPETPDPPEAAVPRAPSPAAQARRVSREELYADLEATVAPSGLYVALVLLSAIVAAVGLVRGNAAVVIGAMVIAPLLGPNMALALATTLADADLARRAISMNALGLVLALAVAVALGQVLQVSPASTEITQRTGVGVSDVALALASGGAGAISYTMGVPATLVGVMLAVALLPPLVVVGLLLGAGHPTEAVGAALLLGTNLICVNLAAVVVFLAQGIRPTTWWEADRARRATRRAIMAWVSLLAVLVALVLLTKRV